MLVGRLMHLVLVVVSLCVGCGQGEPSSSRLELGSGSWRFEPVVEGESVEMVRGAQGGWHLWLSFRTHGFENGSALLDVETQLADESRPPQHTQVPIRLERPDREGRRYFIGWPEVLASPSCFVDQLVRVTARITDEHTGQVIESEIYVNVGGGLEPPTIDCE